jgi:hypothetical protein
MGEIVLSPAAKRFFKNVAQPLGQVFRRRGYRQLMVGIMLPFHNASQGVVLRGPFRFVSQQLLNLFMVRVIKGAIQKDKAARFSVAELCTCGTNYRF